MVDRKAAAENPFDVTIPANYEQMYADFTSYTDGYMLVTGLQWIAADVIED